MAYQHTFNDGASCQLPLGKVVCIGRNYADHAKELNNPVPSSPILFIKPATAVVPFSPSFTIPVDRGECHHETEIAVLIGKTLCQADAEQAQAAIVGLGIGLDLTLRDLQSKLKEKGHPWERAKAFDGACPLTPFVPVSAFSDLASVTESLCVNGIERQRGHTSDMLFPILDLLVYVSHIFTLQPGDVVLTGTPAGVAPLCPGDQLTVTLDERFSFASVVS